MSIVPTLLHVEMLEMWTVSLPMSMPAMPVLILVGPVPVLVLIPAMLEAMVALISMEDPDMDIVALGRIDIPELLLLMLIDPPSM
jgi:hypothetical protein